MKHAERRGTRTLNYAEPEKTLNYAESFRVVLRMVLRSSATVCLLLFLLLIAGTLSLLAPFTAHAGFGISPPSIKETKLVPGSRIAKTIYLVQGNPEYDVPVTVVIESKDMKEWISFDPGASFTIPKGVQQFPLKVMIQVPKNAELGIYKAFIRTATTPPKAEGGASVAISLGGRIDVELTVGNDVYEAFSITNINIEHIRAGESPKVEIEVDNTGNIPAGPAAASFELYNKFGNIRLAYGEKEITEEVPSFTKQGITIEFPLSVRLAQGEYWGNVIIYDDRNSAVKTLRKPFSVKEGIGFAGFMAGVGFAGMLKTGLAVLGGIFVLFILFLFLRRRKRKR